MSEEKVDRTVPDVDTIENGTVYCIEVERGSNGTRGTISEYPGTLRWRYSVRPTGSETSSRNVLIRKEFVFTDEKEQEIITIRRESFFPASFGIMEKGETVGKVKRRNILGTKYEINIKEDSVWMVSIPLYRMNFRAESNVGTTIWFRYGQSTMQWMAISRPGDSYDRVLMALAFIHNNKWNYG